MMARYHPNESAAARQLARTGVQIEFCYPIQLRSAMAYLKAQEEFLLEHPRLEDWLDRHRKEFCDQNRPIWLAKEDGNIVGIIIGRLNRSRDAKVSVLYVSDDNNRYKIMSDLLEKLEEGVGGLGKRRMHVLVYADDRESIGFFVQHGYFVAKEQMLHRMEFPLRVRVLMVKNPLNR